ncbi:8-amino-7-oxononanoate synthase [Adhaeribacter aerolatus]|uniref:8-amino-7-oxononanoate synthase n=1 Tax=Adhaeribacter aerolatus TaxID=670289 RepID=A0A512ATM4_9BACT|nr:aminotransferase class I/II-fold pyridoxal phosphate-dependent enzyme [Adhaeribacter aerolatus]GEO03065.1 8-amino-7-oxononanoate synthase [Adhaeribacter aerolatus]
MSIPILIAEELPGRTLTSGGREYLYFSGTSYLGMSRNEQFQKLLQAGFRQYGLNYSSSRLSNVQLSVFEETENYLATYTGAEAALTVSSGFMAGQLVVQAFSGKGTFIYGPRTHPALWQGVQPINHQSFTEWAHDLPDIIAQTSSDNIFILFNSLDPLWVKKHHLSWLSQLDTTKNITLIIDDSHGLGVTGQNGAGVYRDLVLPPAIKLIVVSSLGKALGIPGGVILAEEATIQFLKNHTFFGGASPVVPAYLAAFLQAPAIYQVAREQLFRNINYFLSCLAEPSLFQRFPDYPVFYTPQNQLYQYLLAHDVLISSFAYPTPQHEPVTRIILNSLHTQADIDKLTSLINTFSPDLSNQATG